MMTIPIRGVGVSHHMTPFPLERQPKDSLLSVVMSDIDTTVLVFPRSRYAPILCLLGLAALISLLLYWIISSGDAASHRKTVGKLIVLIGCCVLAAVVWLCGHYRLTITSQTVAKSMRIFGMNLPLDRIQIKDIRDVVCGKNPFGPTIRLHRKGSGSLFLEGFSSPEERDWVAEGLRAIRQMQTQNRSKGSPRAASG
jgi:hypothetical protein